MSKERREMELHWTRADRRRGLLGTLAVSIALVAACFAAGPAQADFGTYHFDFTATNADGSPANLAGSHPDAVTARFGFNNSEVEPFVFFPDEDVRNAIIEAMPGFVGNTSLPSCELADFLNGSGTVSETLEGVFNAPNCPLDTVVGIAATSIAFPSEWWQSAIYSLPAPPGAVARFSYVVLGLPVFVDVRLKEAPPYTVRPGALEIPQVLTVLGGITQFWGKPTDPVHDDLRGVCGSLFGNLQFGPSVSSFDFEPSFKTCPVTGNPSDTPLLTLPASCTGPAPVRYEADSWLHPESWVSGEILTHDDAEPSNPLGFTGCGRLAFAPRAEGVPTSDQAETGTGLDFNLDFSDEGIENPDGAVESQTKKAVVTLPEGMTINPSVGEGLGVCTPADLDRETPDSDPGEGCPNSSKLGTVHVETPLIDERVEGSVYLAEQDDPSTTEPGAENPFDSLIALYLVMKNEALGVSIKLPLKVEPDPLDGRLVATLTDIPQVPFSHFNLHFSEGNRAPLVTPSSCGAHTTEAKFYPHSDPDNPRTVHSSFEITSGPHGGPCPPGGVPPFEPSFEAGSINNNAGSYSPFVMRLQREDGEQDLTKFSSVLPPGVLGSLAGIEKCSDDAVAVAKAKTGHEEQASPSCPANSEIGSTLAGAGVGSALTYVPGKIYLSGPYKGAPLSVVAITPAIAGPFDAGTVAVRLGLDLNPKTAEVEVDGAASDPIPHILQGIVLKLRDLRVNVDRSNFILNPTSCDESSTKATLFGSNLNVFDPADDVPVDLATRYQAANCLNLGFAPKLGLKLKGGTKRGNFPGLKAHYKPFSGHANIKDLVVRLPRSAFLEQGHIRTICTRVQFAADNCPKAAQYGYIRAWTPLLDEPLQGPVWLRSSNHKLPDLVFDLQGLVDVEVQTRIDSVRGGIRARVEDAPDAPISRVILNMQGGKKGLIVNSRNLCTKRKARANVKGTGQNGKQFTRKPVLRPQCARKAKRARHSRRARVARSSAVG